MPVAAVDTHAIIWYLFNDPRLSQTDKNLLERAAERGEQAAISSISLAEVVYLIEKGRIHKDTLNRLLSALDRDNPLLVEVPVDRYIVEAMSQIDRDTVPDLPDRVIAATALHLRVPLLSRDGKIKLSQIRTVW
jgi:PIN domain nuclease of toxin-antitoxin system